MTNPMSILIAGLQGIPGLRVLGLCELPALTLERALDLLDLNSRDVEADYLGLNHQGWFVRIHHQGRDLLPALFDRVDRPEAASFFRVDGEVMRRLHALPLPYMRLYYHTAREVKKLSDKRSSRGRELGDLSQRLFDWYHRSEEHLLPDLLERRSLLWFKMALVPAVQALLGGAESCLYVTETNGGDIPGLPPEAIVEKKCIVNGAGTRMLPFTGPTPAADGPLAPFQDFLGEVSRFEKLALEAALDPSAEKVTAALQAHPLGIPREKARDLVPLVLQEVEGAGSSVESSIKSQRREPHDGV
jgi:6-phospho-beta-glucosidase